MRAIPKRLAAPLLAAGLMAGAVSASAVPIFTGGAVLTGAQEVPPNGSTATGSASVVVDDNDDLDPGTNTLSWDLVFQGLTSAIAAAHFHAPAPPGVNAPVRVDIGGSLQGPPGLSGQLLGSAPISEQFVNGIRAGLWYLNIHNATFPGGEIRGQVLPEPGMLALLAAGFGALALRRRRT